MQNSVWYHIGKDYALPIISIVISIFTFYYATAYAPQYATVTRDGNVLSRRNFGEYGLSAKKIEFEGYPAYQLTFEKEPDYFEVSTRENATAEVVNLDPKKYRVRFVGSGAFSPVIECDFVVQAF